ncbi:MAG TPA: hypothetical protein VHA06_10275 [Candidatus Angelobacter sp.]|jgi:hypothetical protein|nr:hypothetical protein [Candidatus Angelobacter sp.]
MARLLKNIFSLAIIVFFSAFAGIYAGAQQNPKRLIMKDGTYQASTQWEVTGDRVRYYSAERYGWEEIPKELVDWPATEKYNRERETERDATIKEIAKADEADEREAPLVVPGLRLPNTGGVFLLDTFKNEPQLVELVQNGSDLNKHTSRNILRSVMNPIGGSSTQTLELKGERARVQSHVAQPVIFMNVDTTGSAEPAFTQKASDKDQKVNRYALVRAEKKKDLRVMGKLNVAVFGKIDQKEAWIPLTASALGDWTKLTPTEPLPPGEYAVVELLDKKQINLFVWDFGFDPAAAQNPGAWLPRQPGTVDSTPTPALTQRPK